MNFKRKPNGIFYNKILTPKIDGEYLILPGINFSLDSSIEKRTFRYRDIQIILKLTNKIS